ncbi:MAG: hypothetical protein H7839_24910, partial [Magnetococcus sp. YQC-5]
MTHKHQLVIDFRRRFRKGPPNIGDWRVRCEVYGCFCTTPWYASRAKAKQARLWIMNEGQAERTGTTPATTAEESLTVQTPDTVLTCMLGVSLHRYPSSWMCFSPG